MKIEAARRLMASRVNASLITEARVVMRAVLQYFRDGGVEADYTDDDQDMIVIRTDMHDAIEILDAHRYTEKDRRIADGGLYTSGEAVIMTGGNFELKLMQNAPRRITVCLNR